MPAVMILIMIPVLACVAMMLRIASFTAAGAIGTAAFAALAIGVLLGLLRLTRDLDGVES